MTSERIHDVDESALKTRVPSVARRCAAAQQAKARATEAHVRGLARSVDPAAAKVLRALTDGMGVGATRVFGKAGDTFLMAVEVRCTAPGLFTIEHVYEQDGDVYDPEMRFLLWGGRYFPVSLQMGGGPEGGDLEVGITLIHKGEPARVDRRVQADHTRFANAWMRAVKMGLDRSEGAGWLRA